ncbi:ATP-binding protein [Desulfovibrio sp.]|uniref:hybrid sensor histidine kinase/response regulator n=1 Tax=Desulfovibrio sp. TaxID=885 RepID=UPI0035AFF675
MSRNEDWNREALAAANVGLWVIEIDRNTGHVRMIANPVTLRLLGASEEITPEDCFNLWVDRIDARSRQHLWAIHDEFIADTAMHEVRYLYNHPTWGLVPVRCGGRRISADEDSVVRIVGYHQDMTELHEAHQSLREGLVRLSLACRLGWLGGFEMARLESGELDLTGNDVFYEQFGINASASMAERLERMGSRIVAEDRPKWRKLCSPGLWTAGGQEHLELRVAHPRKGLRWYALAYEVVTGPGVLRITGYISDVTETRQHERILREAKESAEAANAAKSIFLANMSHEIRTPMNGIMGMAHLVLNTPLNAQQRDYVEKIHSTCESLLDIINDLLDFSKVEANLLELEDLPFQPEKELESVMSLLRPKAAHKGRDFTLESYIDPAIPEFLSGDALRLRQILLNLGGNALKFSERGTVRIAFELLSNTGDSVRLACVVSDEGIGMSADELARAFTPFSQADTSITRRFGGTGLGLSLCRHLTALMGGRISVESEPGKGSVFRVELPFAAYTEEGEQQNNEVSADTDSRSLHGLRVLVAEDGDINREIMEVLLDGMGIECISAVNGQEAVELWTLRGGEIDIILMDVQMPIMDGYTATHAIRASNVPGAQSVPIIAMTAYAMRGDAERSLQEGMNAHLTKPVNLEDLTRTLKLFNPRPADVQNTAEGEEPGSRFPGDGDAPSGC